MDGAGEMNSNGRWIERTLLLAVLLLQAMILIRMHGSHRQVEAGSAAHSHSGTGVSETPPGTFVVETAAIRPQRLEDEMDALMVEAMGKVALLQSAMQFHRGWDALNASPSLDMRHTDDGYLVTFSIPGVRPEELGVMLDGRVLTVSALCGTSAHPGGIRRYERRVLLPGSVGALEGAQARLTNGILRVHIPRGGDVAPPHAVMRLF